MLWPIPVAAFVIYPLAKRVTWLCHLALGLTIGIAPMGAWLAVTGDLERRARSCWASPWPAGSPASTSSTRCSTSTSTGTTTSTRSRPASARRAALWFTRGLHVAAIALLVGAGVAAGAGGRSTWRASRSAPRCSLYENAIVRPGDTSPRPGGLRPVERLLAVRVPGLHPRRGDAVAERELVRAPRPGAGASATAARSTASTWTWRPASAWPCSARTAPARAPCCGCSPPSCAPTPASSTVCGARAAPTRPAAPAREIGYLGHDPLVYLDLTARQNLELYADLYGLADARERRRRRPRPRRPAGPLLRPGADLQPRHGAAPRPGPRPAARAARCCCSTSPTPGLDAAGAHLLDGVLADLGPERGAVMVTHEVERGVAPRRPACWCCAPGAPC